MRDNSNLLHNLQSARAPDLPQHAKSSACDSVLAAASCRHTYQINCFLLW